MRNFKIGLGVFIVGVALAALAGLIASVQKSSNGHSSPIAGVLMAFGIAVMWLGPFVFWLVIPIRNRLRRRQSEV